MSERIGFIGLGRMGANMVRRLLLDGHQVVAWNRSADKVAEIAHEIGIGGCPVLPGTLATFECQLESEVEGDVGWRGAGRHAATSSAEGYSLSTES